MTEFISNKTTESLQDIKFKFDDFVQKYKEFCIDKILTNDSGTFPDLRSNDKMIDDFVTREILVDSSDNCLNELNGVSEIIEKLFESEETFIEAMDYDIAQFNRLYNCWKYGNLDDPGDVVPDGRGGPEPDGGGGGPSVVSGRVGRGVGVGGGGGVVPVGRVRGRGRGGDGRGRK